MSKAKRDAQKRLEVEKELAKLKAAEARKANAKAQRQASSAAAAAARTAKLARMSPEERAAFHKSERWIGGAVLVCIVVFVGGCLALGSSSSDGTDASSSSGASSEYDSGDDYEAEDYDAGDDSGSDGVTGDGGQEVTIERATAFDMCKDFVSDRLKAPDGATWRDPYGDQVTYDGDGTGPITVVASVDSENGFGANLRSAYACTVSNSSGDTWTLDDLTIDDGGA